MIIALPAFILVIIFLVIQKIYNLNFNKLNFLEFKWRKILTDNGYDINEKNSLGIINPNTYKKLETSIAEINSLFLKLRFKNFNKKEYVLLKKLIARFKKH